MIEIAGGILLALVVLYSGPLVLVLLAFLLEAMPWGKLWAVAQVLIIAGFAAFVFINYGQV